MPVQIGYPRRFDPAYLAARTAVAGGELGWVHTVRSTTLDPAPPPRGYVAVSGGIFRDCSVHDFDTVRWVTGREVVEVYATGSARGDDFFAELGDVATAQTLLTFDDGATGVVSNTRYNPRGHDVRLELHGTLDSVAAGWTESTPLRNLERDTAWPSGKPWRFFMDRLVDAFRAELTAFTEVVAGQRPSPCTVDDALAVTWIAEAATLSLQQHRPVQISRGPVMTTRRRRTPPAPPDRIAGAPISWGVCEVPGWGYQLAPSRVLDEMRDVGLSATELGPDGLPARRPRPDGRRPRGPPPDRRRRLHPGADAPARPRPAARDRPHPGAVRRHAGRGPRALRGLRAGRLRQPARPRRRRLGACCCATSTGSADLAAEHGVRAVLHPHVGHDGRERRRGPAGARAARRSRCAWTPGTC